LHFFALEFARSAYRLRLFADAALGGLFIGLPEPHFAENALALQFPLQRLQGLVDIVIADKNLQTKPPATSHKSLRRWLCQAPVG
jgi:hypothetical protein